MKKIILIIFISLITFGCSINDDFSDKYIYTTMYPLEYATETLYGEYSNVESVYPDGADQTYSLTDKKKKQYSKGETFVYSGLAKEATLAKDLLNINQNLQIIDATKGMNINYSTEELWLDPSNYLMLCSNIKRSLINYNENVYTKDKIEENYKKLNEKISELDVELYSIGKNGNYNTILTTNNALKYLTKYNINVISIDQNNELADKSYAEAKKLINSKDIDYVYILENQPLTETQENFISQNSLVKINIDSLYTLSQEEKEEEENYISLMKNIITNYKKELYKK